MAPSHPLRRISTGSLSSLAKSTDRTHISASGLDHLTTALVDLSDEAATLSANVQQMTALHDALGTFNEAFAGYLYALKMNAFCVEWPQAPNELSFQRLEALEAPDPTPVLSALAPPTPSSGPSRSSATGSLLHTADMTYATAHSFSADDIPAPVAKAKANAPSALKKPGVGVGAGVKKAAATTAAARKKRELEISGIIDTLPLEYRGGEPAERIRMEKVIAKLMSNPQGIPLKDMVDPPELPQAKVNKCLITLVAKKLVSKPIVNKVTVYRWGGP